MILTNIGPGSPSSFRWSNPWRAVREGGFGDLRYFPGGTINVADNCVDRHAENPNSADKPAVIWEGEDGDVRRVTYRELHDAVWPAGEWVQGAGDR